MIRIGILGAAKIAPPALIAPARKRDDCAVVCVAARDGERARAYAAEHGIPESLGSYDALIAHPGIDLIYNALPPHLHARLTIAALEAGKAVLCEKPFAMNAREAGAMAEARTTQRTRPPAAGGGPGSAPGSRAWRRGPARAVPREREGWGVRVWRPKLL